MELLALDQAGGIFPLQVTPNKTEKKLDSFRDLPVGWDYGRGGPISTQVIIQTKSLLNYMILLGLTVTEAFPGSSGEVMLAAYVDDHCIEIVLDENNQVSLTHEENDAELSSQSDMSARQARSALKKIAEEIWNTSDSFTPENTIVGRSDLQGWLLTTAPGTGAVYPLFRSDA